MRLKEINKPIKEYRNVVIPKDEAHYRELMKHLQDMELDPVNRRDEKLMAEIRRRRMELRNWAEKNIKRESQPDVGAERADAARGMWASSKEIQSRFKTWQDFMNSEDFDEWLDDKFREDMIPNNMPGNIGDYAHEKSTGKLVRIVDYTDDDEGIYTISYGEGQGETDVTAGDLEFIDPTVHQDLDDKILDKEVDEGFIGKKPEYTDFLQNKLEKAMQEYDTPEKKAQRDALMKQYLAKGGSVEKIPAGQKAFVGKKLKPAYRKDNGTPITSPGSDESVKELDDKERTISTIKHSSDKDVAFFDKMMKRYGPKLMELIIDYSHINNDQKKAEKLKKWGREDDVYLSDYYNQLFHVDEDLISMLMSAADNNPKLIDFFYDKVEQAKKAGQFAKTSRLPDPDQTEESAVQEDAPFDGKGILQRAVFNKWISAEEWYHLKDEWQDAARELEQRYSDWPDGEGFGSSDHNFAIRDLMSIVGYEFDDQDTSGKFVVTKMPEKLEKLGITNVRMKGEPVATEAEQNEDTEATLLGKAEASLMHGLEMAQAVLKKNYGMAEVQAKVISENWPPLIDKIKNVYKTTEQNQDGLQPVDLKRLGQTEPKIYVHKDGKTIMIPKRKHNEYLAKGWKKSALRAETSYESKLAEMLKQRLK